MLGKRTLFAPGFDHAGISTQSVVEKRLFKTQAKTRHDLGRERFLETVMDWKNEYIPSSLYLSIPFPFNISSSYQGRITNQLHRLGGSYDWNRVAFTMNDVCPSPLIPPTLSNHPQTLSKAVIETFCKLHEDGTLYRANRLVNWCVKMNTTLSNLEVRLSLYNTFQSLPPSF